MRVVAPSVVAAGLVVAGLVVAGLVMAVSVAPRASGQEDCSCTEKDPATEVELQITAATPEDHSRIGPEQETLVVDLRGEQTVLIGDPSQALAGVDIAGVPVLMAVDDDASSADECGGVTPAAGSDLSLTGQVYMEETGPVVWTGPCQGTLTIEAAPPSDPVDEDTWERGLVISALVLAGLAFLCLALALLTSGGEDDGPAQPAR